MNQGKKVAFVTKASIVPAEEIWIGEDRYAGKFVLRATCVVDRGDPRPGEFGRSFSTGEEIRTSFLVRIDIGANEFETMNTLYKVIPENQVNTYRMCVPDNVQ